MIEALLHDRNGSSEPALDFVRDGERQHEFLAGRPRMLRRGEDGPEIVARMAEAAGRHVAVEKINVTHKTGVEECCLISGGLAASDQCAAAQGSIFLELFAQRSERRARQRSVAQPTLSRILRLKSCRMSGASCSGRAAAAKAPMRSTAERVSCPG